MDWPVEILFNGVLMGLKMSDENDRSSVVVLGENRSPVGPRADYDVLINSELAGWLILKIASEENALRGRLIMEREHPPLTEEYFTSGSYRALITEIENRIAEVRPFGASYFEIPFVDVLVIGEGNRRK